MLYTDIFKICFCLCICVYPLYFCVRTHIYVCVCIVRVCVVINHQSITRWKSVNWQLCINLFRQKYNQSNQIHNFVLTFPPRLWYAYLNPPMVLMPTSPPGCLYPYVCMHLYSEWGHFHLYVVVSMPVFRCVCICAGV